MQNLVIIIVNLDLKDDTVACIDSLIQAGASLEQIILVDNGSHDDSVNFIRNRFGLALEIIEAKENRGYAAGLNLGIAQALKKDYQWMLLMNNDTLVERDFLIEFEKATQTGKAYTLFAPMILYHSHPDRVWFLGGKVVPGTMISYHIYRDQQEPANLPDLIPVDIVHGCAMLVHRDVFQKIGLFNDISLIYAEEVDFCWRARLAGFQMVAVPHARMYHKISAYMSKQKPRTRYLRVRNQIWFYRRYARGLLFVVMFIFSIIHSVGWVMKDFVRGHASLLGPTWAGWLDGWRGRGSDLRF